MDAALATIAGCRGLRLQVSAEPADNLRAGLAHVWILIVALDVIVRIEPHELFRADGRVIDLLCVLRQQREVLRAVNDQQRRRRDQRRVHDGVVDEIRVRARPP